MKINFSMHNTIKSGVYELLCELIEEILTPELEKRYPQYEFELFIFVTCISEEYGFDTKIEYTEKEAVLNIDAFVPYEFYSKQYNLERRYYLGKEILIWLEQAFECEEFKRNHPNFDKEEFMNFIKDLGRSNDTKTDSRYDGWSDWGKEYAWFIDEVDYSLDLDK